MKVLILICALLFSNFVVSQNEQLALDYFNSGKFEKALISYKRLYESNKGNANYLIKIVQIHQQLEQFDLAETLLHEQMKLNNNPQ